jgi:hypothetical protein
MAIDLTSTSTAVTYTDGTTSTIAFSWQVTGVKVKNQGTYTNAVVQTYWDLTATDNTNKETAEFKGATPFTTEGSTSTFVAFTDLTEPVVLGWIQNYVASLPTFSDHIFGKLVEQLENKVVALSEPDLPWGNPETPEPNMVVPGATGATGP